jgi:hypothetical protein
VSSASALPDPWFCVTCKVRKNAGFFFMYSKVRKNAGFLFYTFIAHTYTDAFCRVIIGILRPCHAHAHRHTQAAATLHPSHTHIHTHAHAQQGSLSRSWRGRARMRSVRRKSTGRRIRAVEESSSSSSSSGRKRCIGRCSWRKVSGSCR